MGCRSLGKNNKESLEQGILNKSQMENAFFFLFFFFTSAKLMDN